MGRVARGLILTVTLTKLQIIREIETYLEQELEGAGPERVAELERLRQMYRFLPRREYGAGDVIVPSALVELELDSKRMHCLMVPSGGGLVLSVEGAPVQVVTPASPLGEALLGKKQGEKIEVAIRGGVRSYRIISVR